MKHIAQILAEAGSFDRLLELGRKGLLDPLRRFAPNRTTEDLRALRKAVESERKKAERERTPLV